MPAAIVEWVQAGCKTSPGAGRPRRDRAIEREIEQADLHWREMIPPEDLPENAILFSLKARGESTWKAGANPEGL